jgi:hypothetical protein
VGATQLDSWLSTAKLTPESLHSQASTCRDHAIINHPPGAETQFDWLELPDPPTGWGWGSVAHLLVGALALGEVAGGAGPVRGPATSERGPRRGRTSPGWVHEAVAVRPDGDRVSSADRSDHRDVRAGPSTTGPGLMSARLGTVTGGSSPFDSLGPHRGGPHRSRRRQ